MSVAATHRIVEPSAAPDPPRCPTPRGYDDLVALKAATGRPLKDLIVLEPKNDPFACGRPAQVAHAAWFAQLWRRALPTGGRAHLRRIHYLVYSWGDVTLPDGEPYANTTDHWDKLGKSSRFARYLGLVAATDVVDQRTPPPTPFCTSREQPTPAVWTASPALTLPAITTAITPGAFDPPEPLVMGYDYDPADQPYHLELWIEKSTMDDVLVPICRRYGVNLVTGAGHMSITSIVALLKRAVSLGKPVRLFYVSDFDRAGDSMPRQVARQIEFWLEEYAPPDADIKLIPLVLTREQVNQYDLPNAPGESAEHNRAFEERQGCGVVELDALEALHPGELARIVREALAAYQDDDLADRLADASDEADELVAAAWEAQTAAVREHLTSIRGDVEPIQRAYQARLTALAAELTTALRPYQERLDALAERLSTLRAAFDPDLPERPEPELLDDDDEPWLYDSQRDYLEQLDWYHRHKRGVAWEPVAEVAS